MAAIEMRNGVVVAAKRIALSGASLLALFNVGPVAAQQPGPQMTPQSQIDTLHQALHLTYAQEGAWQLYRSAADIPEQAQARRRAASSLFRKLDSPHRMDLVEAEMQQELADLQRQSQALKAFYGALTAAQRAIFDAQTLPPLDDTQAAPPY